MASAPKSTDPARAAASSGKRSSKSSSRGRSSSRKPVKRQRAFSRRWLWLAALLGVLWALLWQAPASWLSAAVWKASGQHVLLAQAQGTWRDGSALLVLEGGVHGGDTPETLRAMPGAAPTYVATRLAW